MAASSLPSKQPYELPTMVEAPEEETAPSEVGKGKSVILHRSVSEKKPFKPEFGNYELLQELGQGGMGVVYKARQKSLNRLVALKMILPGTQPRPDEIERFQGEAEAAGRLQHPNIVAVHEVGVIEGQYFYSMEFIDGPSLALRVAQEPLPCKNAARYVAVIAHAIHYAHTNGILHRDLKPSNILLDADDQPHILDFGLAKRLGQDSSQTRTGVVMGTPSYMAPEQAAGRTKELGPACDIYGLGAILYDLVTGRPPFRAENPVETIRHVLDEEPAPPRLLNPNIDRDLETICLKCLEKHPEHRYRTAQDLASDLDQYINGGVIHARSYNLLDRMARAFDRSHLDVEFREWGNMLLAFGAIVFLAQLVTFILIKEQEPRWLDWVIRASQFGLLAFLFHRFRSRTFLPTNSAERQLWAVWIGYLLGYVFLVLSIHYLVQNKIITRGPDGPERWDELLLYPVSSLLTGLAFFIMGSNYWGRCYGLGLVFFVLAVLMPLNLEWAPLVFGFTWSMSLMAVGIHVRNLANREGDVQPSAHLGTVRNIL